MKRISALEKATGITFLCACCIGLLTALVNLLSCIFCPSTFISINSLLFCGGFGVGIYFASRLISPFDQTNPFAKRNIAVASLVLSCILPVASTMFFVLANILFWTNVLVVSCLFCLLVFYACVAVIVLSSILLSGYAKYEKQIEFWYGKYWYMKGSQGGYFDGYAQPNTNFFDSRQSGNPYRRMPREQNSPPYATCNSNVQTQEGKISSEHVDAENGEVLRDDGTGTATDTVANFNKNE